MAKSTKKFTLNDEDVANSYGFYVMTDGIGLSRFETNPVMLSAHQNSNEAVLGKWHDWLKEGALLTAYPEFDSEDPDVAKIEGKVERGFIKGVSMGLLFSGEDMVYAGGKIVLKKCELVEASIIPVPSNRNAIRLYLKGREDKPLTENEVKELCLGLSEQLPENLIQENTMSKINLGMRALIALGIMDAPKEGLTEGEIETKIFGLSADLEDQKKKVEALTKENQVLTATLATQATAEISGLIDQAVTDGKIMADEKEAYLSLAQTNAPMVKNMLEKLTGKVSLGAQAAPGGTKTPNTTEVKTIDDFVKLDQKVQLAFKTERPDEYAKLFSNN